MQSGAGVLVDGDNLKGLTERIRKARAVLDRLEARFRIARRKREKAFVADFDAGLSMKALQSKYDVGYNTAASILHRNDRHVWQRDVPIASLPRRVRLDYARWRRNKMPKAEARQRALAAAAQLSTPRRIAHVEKEERRPGA